MRASAPAWRALLRPTAARHERTGRAARACWNSCPALITLTQPQNATSNAATQKSGQGRLVAALQHAQATHHALTCSARRWMAASTAMPVERCLGAWSGGRCVALRATRLQCGAAWACRHHLRAEPATPNSQPHYLAARVAKGSPGDPIHGELASPLAARRSRPSGLRFAPIGHRYDVRRVSQQHWGVAAGHHRRRHRALHPASNWGPAVATISAAAEMAPWRACTPGKPCCWAACEHPDDDDDKWQCGLCSSSYHECCRLVVFDLQGLMRTGGRVKGSHEGAAVRQAARPAACRDVVYAEHVCLLRAARMRGTPVAASPS